MMNSFFMLLLFVLYFLLLGYGVYQYRLGEKPTETSLSLEDNFNEKEQNYVHGWRLIKWTLISAAIAIFGMIPLMGIPGGLFIEGLKLLGLFNGSEASASTWAWPLAILMTLILPVGIPLSIAVYQYGEAKSIEWLARYGGYLTGFAWLVIMGIYANMAVSEFAKG